MIENTDKNGFTDRMQISELLSRYFAAIDDKCLDRAIVDATYTTDARVMRPDGSALVGREAIFIGNTTSFARFRATHHVTTDHVFDFEGDTATLRTNLLAMHLWSEEESDPNSLQSHFEAGGVFHVIAVRTDAGWRISELSMHNVWRTGAGFSKMKPGAK